jgi:predicted nucleic acid-binding protein
MADLTVYPYTKETALRAGKIDGEQQSRGMVLPFGDLLIEATALSLGYKVLTGNLRDFRRIPGLTVMQFWYQRPSSENRFFALGSLPTISRDALRSER